ncbi:tetratricopeptide repeat protein [Porphyromonas asaccharolytica]|uniref:Tetratricopeptide TPR_1 repeat-containing protein n=1 Tax=Porphyromonas asaccharolytica (strain ATCC 25260 / DSM 20707 / BCRC 10618 / CCUG 7834 / JCM 6326 / LMG 13178 / VPI 4198 / B440) TaxID=879243 RepID=F4KND9_PORAD|nr:tetratricopeptide repeat protein [Porphyromonas asaccharolytica]AEE13450.1 Tetratricopeptide TPR_1 repeat-containing protein [Porphyromonas asaccharolytica DSM 20707]
MKTTRKVTLVLLVLMSALTFGCAQTSNVRGADRLSDGSKPNYPEARNLIKQAIENPETKDDPKTWYTAGLIEERAFTGENQKSLKGEPQDLPNMYAALLAMHEYYTKTYEIDHQPNDKGKVRPKFEKKISKAYEDNLLYYINAGGYYMEQKDFKNALKAFQAFREIKRSPLFEGEKIAQPDSNSMMVDFFAIITAYQAGDKQLAIKYGEELKGNGYRQNEVYQILAQTYIEEGDTANYITTMQEGLKLFPKEPYYSVNLINTYIVQNKYDEARTFLAQAIELNPENPQLYDVMGKLYEESNEEEAIKWFSKALEVDPNYVESLCNIGRIYYNKAVEVSDKEEGGMAAAQKKRTALLNKALPYLQKAYSINPDASYYLLGNIYYALGDNAKYEEIQAAHGN